MLRNLVLRASSEIVGYARNSKIRMLSAVSYQPIGQEEQSDTDVTGQKTSAELLQNHDEYIVLIAER
jgi:hypothetical protein